MGAQPDHRAGAQHPGLGNVGVGVGGFWPPDLAGAQEMLRLEVAPEGRVKGGGRASSPRWADRKMPGSGVLAFNAAPGGGDGRGRGGTGRRMRGVGWSGWTVRPPGDRRSQSGAPRAPGPRAGGSERRGRPASAACRRCCPPGPRERRPRCPCR